MLATSNNIGKCAVIMMTDLMAISNSNADTAFFGFSMTIRARPFWFLFDNRVTIRKDNLFEYKKYTDMKIVIDPSESR